MSICGSIVDIMTTIHAVLMTTSLNTYTGHAATSINILTSNSNTEKLQKSQTETEM